MISGTKKLGDIWAIRLDFGPDEHGRKLTLTFSFLSGLIRVLTVVTAMWAIAAGFLQSGVLMEHLPQIIPQSATGGILLRNSDWLAPVLGTPVYAAKAFSASMLIGLAAATVGALMGFLFGVPRPISDAAVSAPTAQPVSVGGSQAATSDKSSAMTMSGQGLQASTNLTQVSDWLTKIIVGVGLVEATTIYDKLSRLSENLGGMLFDGMFAAPLVVPSLMISGAILGFLYAYLFTQLFLATLMAVSAQQVASPLAGLANAIATMSSFSAGDPTLADSITAGPGTEPIPKPSEPTGAQTEAAANLGDLSLDSLHDPGTILAWSRARAVQRRYGEAAKGYRKLLQFVSTPNILAETARVLNANGELAEARKLLDMAVAGRAAVSPDVRSRITFDAANLALYDPPPAGYTRALELLSDDTLTSDPKGALHILRACANAQKYDYEGSRQTEPEERQLRATILADTRRGLSINPGNIAWVRYLWDPYAPGKAQTPSPDRDNDLEPFYADPDFKALLGPTDPPAATPAPAAPA